MTPCSHRQSPPPPCVSDHQPTRSVTIICSLARRSMSTDQHGRIATSRGRLLHLPTIPRGSIHGGALQRGSGATPHPYLGSASGRYHWDRPHASESCRLVCTVAFVDSWNSYLGVALLPLDLRATMRPWGAPLPIALPHIMCPS
jgi:hypothetical protein